MKTKKKIKKTSLSVILMVVAVCALFTATLFGLNAKNAYAEDTTAAQYTLEVSDGISLKLNDQGGMRFVVKTNKATYNYLKSNDGVTLNVLIGPASQFTTEATYATLKDSLIKVAIDKAKIFQINGDENYYANACVVEMLEANREIDYTAVAYLLNGETVEAQSVVNNKAVGDFYAVTNQSVIETESTAAIFANAAYNWFGTENYAIKLDTLDEYAAFIGKINGVDLTQKYVTLGDYEVADKSKLAAFKKVTAQNKITALTVADVVYGGTPAPSATAYFGEATVTYTYATALDGEYSAWNAANGIGAYFVKATVIAGEDGNVTYAAAEEIAQFNVTKAANAISGFTKDDSVTLHCGDPLPTFSATATFGTVEYTYSLDGATYKTAEELGDIVAGTLYVKATVAGTDDYAGVEATLTYAVTHNMVEATVDGITTNECACGKKEVSGNIANSQVSLNVQVADGVASATGGELDLTKAFNGTAAATVTVGKTEVTDVQIASGKLSLAGANFAGIYGEQNFTVVFTDGDGTYNLTVSALVVTKEIANLADLKSIKTISETAPLYTILSNDDDGSVKQANYGGYYLLTNDITFGATDYWNDYSIGGTDYTKPFVGTIDGAGHKIDGLVFFQNWGDGKGFIQTFGRANSGATLKNVAFTNFYSSFSSSIVKNCYFGSIENVYVQFAVKGDDQKNGAAFNDERNSVVYMNNVVLDFSAVSISNLKYPDDAMFLGYFKDGSVLENVVVFGVDSKFNKNIIKYNGNNSLDQIYVYNSDTHTANKAIPATGWSEAYWTVNANSLPVFKSAASAYVTAATFGEKVESLKKGETPTFTAGKNSVIELSEEAKLLGITLIDGVLTVPDTVEANKTFTVIARNLFDYDNPNVLTVTYLGEVLEAEVDGSNLTIDLNTAADGTVAGTDVEIDLSSVYSDSAENVIASYKGTSFDVTLASGKLTFNTKNLAGAYDKTDIVVTIKDSNGTTQITVKNIFVITKKIGTLAELRTVTKIAELLNGGGYYMLSKDITFGTNDNWNTTNALVSENNSAIGQKNAFKGTFDGAGFSISGLKSVSNWNGLGFINNMGNTGVLKNVAFFNVTLQNQDTIVTNTNGGKIENVYVQIATYKSQMKSGLFGIGNTAKEQAQTVILNNVVVDLTTASISYSATAVLLGNFKSDSTFTNVVVLGVNDALKGNVNKVDGKLTDNYIYMTYNTAEETAPTGTFSADGWDEAYWTVDASANTVTWKAKA